MLRWIEKTREKPKVVRNSYAFFIALGVTSVIALVWAVSLPARFEEIAEEVRGEEESQGAFAQFMNEAKEQAAAAFSATDSTESESETVNSSEGNVVRESEESSSVEIPTLEVDNVKDLQAKEEERTAPKPRTVLIATTTNDTSSSTNDEQ